MINPKELKIFGTRIYEPGPVVGVYKVTEAGLQSVTEPFEAWAAVPVALSTVKDDDTGFLVIDWDGKTVPAFNDSQPTEIEVLFRVFVEQYRKEFSRHLPSVRFYLPNEFSHTYVLQGIVNADGEWVDRLVPVWFFWSEYKQEHDLLDQAVRQLEETTGWDFSAALN